MATIGVIAGVGILLIQGSVRGTKDMKLESDVASLNRAIKSYLAQGGSMTGVSTAEEALAKLKTTSPTSRALGYKGGFVDIRLEPIQQTSAEGQTHEPRAFWSAADREFRIATTGLAGIKAFRFNEQLAATTVTSSETRRVVMNEAASDKWLWDYLDSPDDRPLPDSVGIATTTEVEAGVNPAPNNALLPPIFSVLGGDFDYFDFPVSLTLTNPNSGGSGTIRYSVNNGPWQPYTAPLSVGRDSTISAYCASSDPLLLLDSFVRTEGYWSNSPLISGGSTGTFHSAIGGPNMVSSVTPTATGSRFEFGAPATPLGFNQGNTLEFAGGSFSNIQPEQVFRLGTLTYYNSTTWIGTAAYQVKLSVDLSLSEPNLSSAFDFTLDLESTPNHAHLSDDEKADFVRFSNIYADFSAVFGGETYYLNLKFGNSTAGSFTSVDQFHVHENNSASGEILAWFSTSPGGSLPPNGGGPGGNGHGPGGPNR